MGTSFFQIENNTFKNVNTGIAFMDGGPSWPVLSAADYHQVIGTTIQNNNLAGVNQSVFSFATNGGPGVDVAAYNVASGNVLPSLSQVPLFGSVGVDDGSPSLLNS